MSVSLRPIRAGFGIALFCTPVLLAALASPAAGQVIHVDASATGAETGDSWDDAYTRLQDALAASSTGQQIWVAAGTYTPGGIDDPRTSTFDLVNGVAVYGGFAGYETELEQRDPAANETILSGDVGFPNNPFDNSYHVVSASGVDGSTVLDGFTVTGGRADATAPSTDALGGGITCIDASPVIRGCFINNNLATDTGGGMYSTGAGSPAIVNCEFRNNLSRQSGGGLACRDSMTVMIDSCIFAENEATAYGGALDIDNSQSTISHCQFTLNVAEVEGGAIMARNGAVVSCSDCTFEANAAAAGAGAMYFVGGSTANAIDCEFNLNATSGPGGAVFLDRPGGGFFLRCLFESNFAGGRGGGVYNKVSSCFESCVFRLNMAPSWGGGVGNHYAPVPLFSNCVFDRNQASSGGAMRQVSHSCPSVVNCTIVGNQADSGGGIASGDLGEVPVIRNCVIYGNSNGQIVSGGPHDVAYSLVEGGFPGTGNISDAPVFVGHDDGDYRLRGCSPGIDAGSNSAVPVDVVTDADGLERFVDNPDTPDTGEGDPPIVDMGAYEHQGAGCPADLDDDCQIDLSDLSILLADYGCVGETCVGDVDGDGDTDLGDLSVLLASYGQWCP